MRFVGEKLCTCLESEMNKAVSLDKTYIWASTVNSSKNPLETWYTTNAPLFKNVILLSSDLIEYFLMSGECKYLT